MQTLYKVTMKYVKLKLKDNRQKIIIVLSLDSTVCFYFNLNTTALYYAA